MRTLTQFDLTGIQPFLFGARRLRANLGASWLVHTALDRNGWLGEAAESAGSTVLWSGGGNAVVCSEDDARARQVATALALRVIEEAPGLGIMCAHQPWDGNGSSYARAAAELRDALEEAKASRLGDARFDGGGVCERCRDTADPAVCDDEEKAPIGASIWRREKAKNNARERLTKIFRLPEGLAWSNDVDRLGRTSGEESSLGVVHFDGNGMGTHFAKATRRGLRTVQDLSQQVNEAGQEALVAGLRWVAERITQRKLGFELKPQADEDGKTEIFFPVRPVVFGGDDITLLCDGRIALDLAAEMLCAWHKQSKFHATAGVAIVRAHFPFYRAVEQAHALCKRAKRWRKQELSDDASVLHWSLHRESGEIAQEDRRNAKPSSEARQTARPYVVVGAPPSGKPWRSWSWFRRECVQALKEQTTLHTQIKGLAAALAAGPDAGRRALSRLIDRHGYRLPTPPHHQLDVSGFEAGETPYLDALEILDLVAPELP
jgi:hypothetical protein